MPIRHNTKSHDFAWDFEDPSGNAGGVIYMRYHETDDGIPSLSILESQDGSEVLTLPVELFRDAVAEVDRYESIIGMLSGKTSPAKSTQVATSPMPNSGLKLPTIGGKMVKTGQQPAESKAEQETPQPDPRDPSMILDSQEPMVSFLPGEASRNRPNVDPETKNEILSTRGSTPEERAALREQQRASAGKKSLKRVSEDSE
tara:strand:+ start:53296 stop:53898 length:603 start_codon:yes stop_codon:yes gene_type:complete